eukprot:CAMPEP_0114991394 /NCGR_PEP_ID=MMETSP0216-20121206/11345_1 /TAXON_ID=223996 /ORGANISM="Protocruzia adherens, Strain Boccale" /LENGTH=757 /DNA_ID=CAMNT_0002354711 /DNA_START=21 /DNA_END=2294 /DNA_ORIENTATION=+
MWKYQIRKSQTEGMESLRDLRKSSNLALRSENESKKEESNASQSSPEISFEKDHNADLDTPLRSKFTGFSVHEEAAKIGHRLGSRGKWRENSEVNQKGVLGRFATMNNYTLGQKAMRSSSGFAFDHSAHENRRPSVADQFSSTAQMRKTQAGFSSTGYNTMGNTRGFGERYKIFLPSTRDEMASKGDTKFWRLESHKIALSSAQNDSKETSFDEEKHREWLNDVKDLSPDTVKKLRSMGISPHSNLKAGTRNGRRKNTLTMSTVALHNDNPRKDNFRGFEERDSCQSAMSNFRTPKASSQKGQLLSPQGLDSTKKSSALSLKTSTSQLSQALYSPRRVSQKGHEHGQSLPSLKTKINNLHSSSKDLNRVPTTGTSSTGVGNQYSAADVSDSHDFSREDVTGHERVVIKQHNAQMAAICSTRPSQVKSLSELKEWGMQYKKSIRTTHNESGTPRLQKLKHSATTVNPQYTGFVKKFKQYLDNAPLDNDSQLEYRLATIEDLATVDEVAISKEELRRLMVSPIRMSEKPRARQRNKSDRRHQEKKKKHRPGRFSSTEAVPNSYSTADNIIPITQRGQNTSHHNTPQEVQVKIIEDDDEVEATATKQQPHHHHLKEDKKQQQVKKPKPKTVYLGRQGKTIKMLPKKVKNSKSKLANLLKCGRGESPGSDERRAKLTEIRQSLVALMANRESQIREREKKGREEQRDKEFKNENFGVNVNQPAVENLTEIPSLSEIGGGVAVGGGGGGVSVGGPVLTISSP